jgi:hypothetical protein
MQLIRRPENTGSFCSADHPEQIEYCYVLVDGVEVPRGKRGPRCFVAGCPDNEAAKAQEQQRGAR